MTTGSFSLLRHIEARATAAAPDGELPIDQIVVAAGKLTVKKAGKELKTFRLTLDPSKKPKAMEWGNPEAEGGPTLPGIYALEGGELRLCFPSVPRKGAAPEVLNRPIVRPEGFDTRGTTNIFVLARRKQP